MKNYIYILFIIIRIRSNSYGDLNKSNLCGWMHFAIAYSLHSVDIAYIRTSVCLSQHQFEY